MPQVFKRTWVDPKTGDKVSSRWYWLDYRVGGKRVIRRTDPATNNERAAEKQLYAALAGTAKDRDVLVSEVLDNYKSHLRTYSLSTWKSKGYWLDWWKGEYGSVRASEFGSAQVRKAIEVLERKGGRGRRGKPRPCKPGTVRGYLGLVKAAFNLAIDENLIEAHPLARLKIKHQSPKREATFEPAEIAAVKKHLEPWASQLVAVLAETGIRIGDALSLEWSSVDPKARVLRWVQQKTAGQERKPTTVPLTDGAIEAFAKPEHAHGLIFPGPDGRPRIYRVVLKTLRVAMTKAGVLGRTPHDLRRTFAQRLCDRRVDTREIAFLLGQKTTAMVEGKYTSVRVEQARQALEQV